jgi:NAD-dependent deacetylase
MDATALLRDYLNQAGRIVVFTGAGISTESGIPDFRSPGGLWTKHQPIYFEDFMASEEMRRESWRRKMALDEAFGKAKPNQGHRAIAELHRREKLLKVITQNIDGLHQAAGVPEADVIELHGSTHYAKCLECEKRFEIAPILEAFRRDETLPVCDDCGGIVKTATISFGQPMPLLPMRQAEEASLGCDLFLAIGSSLVVYPAAGFPLLAKRNGATLVIVNREPTEQDALADLVLNAEIGLTLAQAMNLNGVAPV